MTSTDTLPPAADTRPVSFGKYSLFEKLGEGGIAQVHRASLNGLQGEKFLAVKRILPQLSAERDLVKAFLEEAKLASLLVHENIVRVCDFGRIDKSFFIAAEYLSGKDLRAVLTRAAEQALPFGLDQALYITAQICSGLDYAHKLKDPQGNPTPIFHRDVSPQNVVITFDGQVKIVDFGIVRATYKSAVAKHEMIKAKVAYMSPEQALGDRADHRSDIFSAGILFYEMATGKRMYGGDTMQAMAKVRKAEFEPPETARSGLPPKVYEILGKVLAKEKEQRYQTCGAMLQDIQECLSELPRKPTAAGVSEYLGKLFPAEVKSGGANDAARTDGGSPASPGSARGEESMESIPCQNRKPDRPVQENPDPKTSVVACGDLPGKPEPPITGIPQKEKFPPAAPAPVSPSPEQAEFAQLAEVEEKPADPAAELESDLQFVQDILKKAQATVNEESFSGRRKKACYAIVPAVILAAVILGWTYWPQEKDGDLPGAEPLPVSVSLPAGETAIVKSVSSTGNQKNEAAVDRTGETRALLEKAAAVAEKNPKEAQALLLKAVELNPRSAQANFQLGLAYMNSNNFSRAVEFYRKTVELDPKAADAYFNLGYIYARQKNYPNAEQMYAEAVKLAPPYLDEAFFNLGAVQEKQGKRRQGIENLERAVRYNPRNETAQKLLVRLKGDS